MRRVTHQKALQSVSASGSVERAGGEASFVLQKDKIRRSIMQNFANIDANRPATFKQFEFAVYKLTQGLAKTRKISEKKAGKLNPAFKILKARTSAACAKYYGDQDKRMSHGDAQKFITTGELPKEIAVLVKTGDDKPKASPKPKAEAKPKASKKTAEQLELEQLRKEVQALLAEREAQAKPKKPTAKEAAAAIAALRS